jgi:succinoglycan biosynthesis protein ExoM
LEKYAIIAIATFKRPKMLSDALESLKNLHVPDGYTIACFVCDNDPDKSAERICERFSKELPFELKYFVQARRGIVHTRNLLLSESHIVGASHIAFFDDDETVHPQWIYELLKTAVKYNAASVSGKVIYTLLEGAPKWLEERNFYGGGRPTTGTLLQGASTNNVLIDLSFLKKHQLVFNPAFNMSGGSDSFLFREVRDYGGKVVSCQEAIAYEQVPLSRAKEEWILNRAYKNGYTELNRNRIRHGKLKAYSIALAYASWLAICHAFGLLGYPFVKYSSIVFNRRRTRKIKGMMLALQGKPYEEYRTIHGG